MIKKRLEKVLVEKLGLSRSKFPFLYKKSGIHCSTLEKIITTYKINPNFLFGIDEEYRLEKVIISSEVKKLLNEDLKLSDEEKERLRKLKKATEESFEEFTKVATTLFPHLKNIPKTLLYVLYKTL